jgi:hypothetical protein
VLAPDEYPASQEAMRTQLDKAYKYVLAEHRAEDAGISLIYMIGTFKAQVAAAKACWPDARIDPVANKLSPLGDLLDPMRNLEDETTKL